MLEMCKVMLNTVMLLQKRALVLQQSACAQGCAVHFAGLHSIVSAVPVFIVCPDIQQCAYGSLSLLLHFTGRK